MSGSWVPALAMAFILAAALLAAICFGLGMWLGRACKRDDLHEYYMEQINGYRDRLGIDYD